MAARLRSQWQFVPLQVTLDESDVGNRISVPHPLHRAVRIEASPCQNCSHTRMSVSSCVCALSIHDWYVAAWSDTSATCFPSCSKLIILLLFNDSGTSDMVVSCFVLHWVGGFLFVNLPSQMWCFFSCCPWKLRCVQFSGIIFMRCVHTCHSFHLRCNLWGVITCVQDLLEKSLM